MSANPWTAYRQHAATSASVAGVFIQCYDQIASLLYSAIRAIEARDIERKTDDLNRALTIIVHLQGNLDREQGDETIHLLDRFYTLARAEIFKGSAGLDAAALRQLAGQFAELRKLWERAEELASQTRQNGDSPSPISPGSSSLTAPTKPDVTSSRWSA
ncbi:MAG TPA: flagellar export chaperone FliS [Terriglobia bacterium]|nr:flagellar export chaperone FliS [Terriglobia bacterium]